MLCVSILSHSIHLTSTVSVSVSVARACPSGPVLISIAEAHLTELPLNLSLSHTTSPPSLVPMALVFDIGGVVTRSPLRAIRDFEDQSRPPIPRGYISVAIAAAGDQGVFQRLERGRYTIANEMRCYGRLTSCPDSPHLWQ